MSYFPSGFWSRLITRILADDAIVDIVRSFFIVPKEVRSRVFLKSVTRKALFTYGISGIVGYGRYVTVPHTYYREI
jgi:hypothetical protein